MHKAAGLSRPPYPPLMSEALLPLSDVAAELGRSEAEVRAVLRQDPPPGTVRTNDGRLLVPPTGVAQLRAALESG